MAHYIIFFYWCIAIECQQTGVTLKIDSQWILTGRPKFTEEKLAPEYFFSIKFWPPVLYGGVDSKIDCVSINFDVLSKDLEHPLMQCVMRTAKT